MTVPLSASELATGTVRHFFLFEPKSFDQPLDARRRAISNGPIHHCIIKLVRTLLLVNETEAVSQWERAQAAWLIGMNSSGTPG
jgi:hypothetical protein